MMYESEEEISNYIDYDTRNSINNKYIINIYNIQDNKISSSEQEQLMHLIYDIIHNDCDIDSLYLCLDSLAEKYGTKKLKDYLNSLMKDTKYSDNRLLPIRKCIFQLKNYVKLQTDEEFFSKKFKVMKILESYGASMIILHNDELTLLYDNCIIDDKIMSYIVHKTNLFI